MNPRAGPLLLLAALATASCQPPDRDIRIGWREGRLLIDFPWSLWRLVGLQDRTWCIGKVELFDARQVRWTLAMAAGERQCVEVEMPLALGRPRQGFTARGAPRLEPGVRYGVSVSGIGDGRVDFILRGPGEAPVNIAGWRETMVPPCGTHWGPPCGGRQAGQ